MNQQLAKPLLTTLAVALAALAAAPIVAKTDHLVAQAPKAEHKVFLPLTANRSYGPTDLGQWQLAVVNNRDGNNEIYRLMADGSKLTRLITTPADERLPRWSPSGKSISFYSSRFGGGRYLLDVATNKESSLVSPVIKPTILELDAEPVWLGANDTLVYFCHTSMLCTRKADGSETREAYVVPRFDASGTPTQTKLVNTVISPDAKYFTYVVMNDDPNWPNEKRYALYLSNAKGEALTAVVPPTGTANLDFAWSPTGQKLAFVQGANMIVLDVGSGVSKTVATFKSQRLGILAWSPDENSLWAGYNDGVSISSATLMCKIALNAAPPTEPNCVGAGGVASVSPDGQWVAYIVANRFDTEIINGVSMSVGRLWVMRSDGSDKRQINITGSNLFVSWNPNPLTNGTKR
ncbi:MAG: PD40 domain-containing protein [Anaerolineae bacterium]|nr:PD40 domain-containing protein [Anaerolineae bacterium]